MSQKSTEGLSGTGKSVIAEETFRSFLKYLVTIAREYMQYRAYIFGKSTLCTNSLMYFKQING